MTICIDIRKKALYNISACRFAMKWNVATFVFTDGGNFHGVCLGFDRAVRCALIPRKSCGNLGFYMVIKETPGCV